MPDPFKMQFDIQGTKATSVVIDKSEFDDLCDNLCGVLMFNDNTRLANEAVNSLKEHQIIPLIKRGTKTQFVFDKYQIDTDLASFIVRGTSKSMGLC